MIGKSAHSRSQEKVDCQCGLVFAVLGYAWSLSLVDAVSL